MDDVIALSIVYKFILDTSKCKAMPKLKSDFFLLRYLLKKVRCPSFHATGMAAKFCLLKVISHSFCQGKSSFL